MSAPLPQARRWGGRQVTLIIANAKHHRAILRREWRRALEPDFCLAYLPPHSPGLPPIERGWKLVRRHCLHKLDVPRLAWVMGAVEAQFSEWAGESSGLQRLWTGPSSQT